MHSDELQSILDNDISLPASVALAEVVSTDQPLLALSDSSQRPDFTGVEIPDGMHGVQCPTWLSECLVSGSGSASQLVGYHIMYKWPALLGGWLSGEGTAVNKDPVQMIKKEMCNYIVHYAHDGEDAHHLLKIADYALSGKSKT